MAAEQDPQTGSTCSEQQLEGHRAQQRLESPSSQRAEGNDSAPATKGDIRQLLQEMKQMFDADMNL
ncbi:Hypothetical predicted protein, partial [Pelobates cultripes]